MQSVVPEEEQREGRQLREALKPRNDILRTFFEAPAAASTEMMASVLSSTARLRSKALCSVGSSTSSAEYSSIAVLAGASTDGASLCCESRQRRPAGSGASSMPGAIRLTEPIVPAAAAAANSGSLNWRCHASSGMSSSSRSLSVSSCVSLSTYLIKYRSSASSPSPSPAAHDSTKPRQSP